MPNFDTSGCPSDFLALVRKLQADIDDKKNLIAREKQLIEGIAFTCLRVYHNLFHIYELLDIS